MMHSKRDPQRGPNTIHESTIGSDEVRGIRKLPDRLGRPNPYGVQWSERIWDAKLARDVRKPKSKYFPDEAKRDKFYTKLCRDKQAGDLHTPSRMEIEEWRSFKAATGDRPWREVVVGWQSWLLSQPGTAAPARLVADVAADYLKELKTRADEGDVALNTYRQHKHKAGLLVEAFGARPINKVTTDDLAKWFGVLNLQVGGTFNNYVKVVSLVFRYGKVSPNPCAGIRRKRERTVEDRKLTIPQIAQLFHTAATVERFRVCLRRLALETFAGVRFSSACRLLDSDIDTEDRGIRHRGDTIKTGERLYVSPYPEVLFKWLAVAPDDSALNYTDRLGKLNRERRYLELKSELFHVARVPHPQNCLRHSFPTYHLAKRGNPGETAYLLCHRNQQKLWNNYKGDATRAEGERFEGLTPEVVGEIAKEWVASLDGVAGK